jgi:hypothetical protein
VEGELGQILNMDRGEEEVYLGTLHPSTVLKNGTVLLLCFVNP